MNFATKVTNLINKWKQNNLTNPNELWIGCCERAELEQYLEEQRIIMGDYSIKNKIQKQEFFGLKVRFFKWAQSSSFLEVDYNSHYQTEENKYS